MESSRDGGVGWAVARSRTREEADVKREDSHRRVGRCAAALALLAACALRSASAVAAEAAAQEMIYPQISQSLSDVPGKNIVVVVVDYPPGVKSVPHRHGSAFVYARVLSGAIRSQVDDEPARVYQVGDQWTEVPGSHHVVSENASATEPAQLLAVFVANAGEKLFVLDGAPKRAP
jgi:quercetin dioxygenase-like cupin family protein